MLSAGLPRFQVPQVQHEMQKINMELKLLIHRQDHSVFHGLSLVFCQSLKASL